MAKKVMYRGTGRRKRSVARVMLSPGTGKFVINGRNFDIYIPSAATRLDVEQPLTKTENLKTFDIQLMYMVEVSVDKPEQSVTV